MYLEQWLYGPGMPRKGFFFLWLMTRQSRMNIFYSHALVFTHFPQIWSNAITGLKYRLIRISVESRFYNYSAQIVFFWWRSIVLSWHNDFFKNKNAIFVMMYKYGQAFPGKKFCKLATEEKNKHFAYNIEEKRVFTKVILFKNSAVFC